ncbi:sensor histidine kinase [Acidovorax sp. NCPPB 3576]|uniref:sensor histidine kinase n=1 Tax=Acidovorax sp. NCPPB 3576 TaxID=2940488 RepID=UPI00234B1392|nr:sensor histidine kinase [Acidovorax sp. NCPPB 3576]WCM87390.1 sensor histidine kinase [Acidovorax sp. NCPPB 3576]
MKHGGFDPLAAPPAPPPQALPARGLSAWALALAQWPMATRIAVLALVPMLLLVATGGLWLRGQMHQSLLGGFEQVLREKVQRVGARLQQGPNGELREATGSADEFSAIYAGWYWRAQSGGEALRSRSLWDMDRLPTDPQPLHGSAVLHLATGPLQEPLLSLTLPIPLGQPPAQPSAQPVQVALTVYGPAAQLQTSMRQIDRTLVLAGLVLMLLAGGLAWLQVRVGLAPLRRLEALLAALRAPQGDGPDVAAHLTSHLAAPTGRDLQPLQNELAGLLAHNAHVVARARAHAVDLNHALKKPLALLSAQASAHPQVPSSEVRQQVDAMAQLVDRYQARTLSDALHAHPGAAGQAVDVRECLSQVVRMMERLHAAQELDWALEDRTSGRLLWRGEQADLQEVLGNLLDNAGKWAASRVRLTLSRQEGADHPGLRLDIEDDGPGMTAAQLQAAGQRGVRFDESVQGSGLGLAIASQIAQAYGGQLQLDKSEALRGLRVRLEMRGLVRGDHRPAG